MSLLECNDVRYGYNSRYQQVDVLKGVSCHFDCGKVYGLVGKSGSGKSTLLSLLAGLDTPQSGEIRYDGIPTSAMDLSQYRRECAAVIYQNFRLFPLLTAMENVMYPMELCNIKGPEARARAKELIARVALPETVLDRFPAMLSGGEQQRVAIARAFSVHRKLILADEPTGNLDSENSRIVLDLLIRLTHEENYCVIIATHDLNVLSQLDEVYQMSDGEIGVR